MTIQRVPRRSVFALAAAFLSVAASIGCSDSEPSPNPTSIAQGEVTVAPSEAPRPPGCASIPNDVCDVALAFEAALRDGDGSRLEVESKAKPAFATMLARRNEPLKVVSIGCPFAAVELGCGATFAIGISSVIPGTDAARASGLTYSAIFTRDAGCDFSSIYTVGPPAGGPSSLCKPDGTAGTRLLTEVKFITEGELLNPVVNGSLAQGGTLAGRPKGITDTHVRSKWSPFPDETKPPVPAVLAGVAVREFELGPSVQLDGMLFIATGCWGCDGPTSGIDRVYRRDSGLVREKLTLPGGAIRDVQARPNSQELYVVTCNKDYCGGLGPGVHDLVSTIHRSLDGGITWETVATFEDYASLGPFTDDGYLVTVGTPGDDASEWIETYFLMPGRVPVSKPPGTSMYSGSARILPDGSVGFQTVDGRRWLRADGSTGYEVPFDVDSDQVSDIEAPDGGHLISWSVDLGIPRRTGYQVLWRKGTIETAFQGGAGRIGHWLGPDSYVGNTFASDSELGLADTTASSYERSIPAFVSLRTGVISPIETEFFAEHYRMDRAYVMSAWPGNLARVNTPGDCLQLRELASAASKSLGCYQHGAIVAEDALGGTPEPGWVRVIGPAGQVGWMAAEFLER